jgi:hypothetical protein
MQEINCPACGAKTSSVIANCEYCGIEIPKIGQLTPQEYIKALSHRLERAGEDDYLKGRDNAIKGFPIPSDIPTLTDFFIFCHGNTERGIDRETGESGCWLNKAKAAYDRLRLASLNNPQLMSFLEEYKSTYSDQAMKADSTKNSLLIVLLVVGICAMVLFLFLIIFLIKKSNL